VEQDLLNTNTQGIADTSGETDAAPYKIYATKQEYQQDFDAKMGKRLGRLRAMEEDIASILNHFGADSVQSVLDTPSEHLISQVEAAIAPEAERLAGKFGPGVPGARALAEDTTFVRCLSLGLSAEQSFLAAFGESLVKESACPVEGAASDSLTNDIFTDVQYLGDAEIRQLAEKSRRGERITF